MIIIVARRQLTDWLRDGRLPWAGGLMLLLFVVALVVGQRQQVEIVEERQAGMAASYEHWLAQEAKNPHSAVHHGMYVFAPTPPLLQLDPGVSPYLGSAVLLEAHRQNDFQFRPARDASGLQRFGNLSAATVLQVLVPLLIIILGYNSIAGEREEGTLRHVLSLGVSPLQLLLGKLLALFPIILLPLMLAGLIAAVGATSTHNEQHVAASHRDVIVRLIAMLSTHALYLTAVALLTLAVSARAGSSRQALSILLGLWIFNVLIAPRAAADIAGRLEPAPSTFRFNQELVTELFTDIAAMREERFKAKRWTDLPASAFGDSLIEGSKVEIATYERHYLRLWTILDRQQGLQQIAAFAAPMIAMRAISASLAGADVDHHRHFAIAAEQYRRDFERRISLDAVANGGDLGYNYFADPKLWATVAPFSYQPLTVGAALRSNAAGLAALALSFGVAVSVAFAALRRLAER